MTWRFWQRNEYDDGTSDVVTYLMPLLEAPFEGVFNDYSDGSSVEFSVNLYDTVSSSKFTSKLYSIDALQALITDMHNAGWVLVSVSQTPFPTTPEIEPEEPIEPDTEA